MKTLVDGKALEDEVHDVVRLPVGAVRCDGGDVLRHAAHALVLQAEVVPI